VNSELNKPIQSLSLSAKKISECCEVVNICHINCSGPVGFFRHSVLLQMGRLLRFCHQVYYFGVRMVYCVASRITVLCSQIKFENRL